MHSRIQWSGVGQSRAEVTAHTNLEQKKAHEFPPKPKLRKCFCIRSNGATLATTHDVGWQWRLVAFCWFPFRQRLACTIAVRVATTPMCDLACVADRSQSKERSARSTSADNSCQPNRCLMSQCPSKSSARLRVFLVAAVGRQC